MEGRLDVVGGAAVAAALGVLLFVDLGQGAFYEGGGPAHDISKYMYSYILIIMLLGVGLYFTFRGKLLQLRLLGGDGGGHTHNVAGAHAAGGGHHQGLEGGDGVFLLVGICVFGGGKRIVKVTGVMVPIMGVVYILVALVVVVLNIANIPMVLGRIFTSAFDFQAIFGGFMGSCIMEGIKRGLYSNESGDTTLNFAPNRTIFPADS